MSQALLELLKRRYGLSAEAEPIVERLILAWDQGHTALALNHEEAALMKREACVSQGAAPQPLVLLAGPRLQSWRLHEAEQRIQAGLLRLANAPLQAPGNVVEAALAQLWPDAADKQRLAATLGLSRQLALITGGPGTGKTFTAARLLALLQLQQPGLRVALAAPTGKAAQRLGESVAAAAASLPSSLKAQAAALTAAGQRHQTLHRLLAWRPAQDVCLYNAQRPLPYDLVLVDEASMLDVMLWDALLQALGPHTRLVVLGDQRQLESVEPGRVLGALVELSEQPGPLQGCHVELTRNYRFDLYPGIGRLAQAIRENDGAGLLKAAPLSDLLPTEVERFGSADLDAALDRVWPQVLALATAADPAAALRALAQLRFLCALNQGPYGVAGVNARIQARLAAEGRLLHATPVLVTVNDPQSGLFNGDLGVLLPQAAGALACFGDPAQPRQLPALQLPEHQLAWAMTVHRAQGSEYQTVVLVLPPEPHELVGPELLYTAVTRARERVLLVGDEAALMEGTKKRPQRVSSLGSGA